MILTNLIPFLIENQDLVKVHCAIGRFKKFEPLYEFAKGKFKEWQEDQKNKNFERDYILSIIYYNRNEWVFAGIYKRFDVIEMENGRFKYTTELIDDGKELIGRVILGFEKDFRQSYLKFENHSNMFHIIEMKRTPYKFEPFPGYENVKVSYSLLKEIISANEQSWKTALSNIKGVYLISDNSNGKLYVGSAYGEVAFWNRWKNYTDNGHGGNIYLKEILGTNDINYADNFSFSILEIMKMTTDDTYIIQRESYWKSILLSRVFGYNKN